MATQLRGVFPALVTPMTANRDVDHAALATFIDYLIEEGNVHGIIPLGSTGEYYALSADERTAVLETTFAAVDGRVPVVAGANAGATRDVIAFCRQAEQLGAAGVLLAAPYYSLPTPDELFEHFRAVDGAIGIPIMLYNYPGRTGVDMTPDLVERLAQLERVQYIKESTGDITRVSQIIQRCGDQIAVFCGCDTIALESFVLGAIGWVGGVVNVLPKEHVELFQLAVEKGDIAAARKVHYGLLPVLLMMEGGGKYSQFVKAGCEITGHSVGPPRPPLRPASADEVAALRELLL